MSGLSPSIIIECAGRGLSFYTYQASQEIIYQQHLAKGLTEKYTSLSQQMEQLIHDANAQIKVLQDKLQGLLRPVVRFPTPAYRGHVGMQDDHAALEAKNHELYDAFRDKGRAQQHLQKLYQALKAQVMASHVANAAGNEADIALDTVRSDRFVNRLPGARVGTANLGQSGLHQQGRQDRHRRDDSASSESPIPVRFGGRGVAPGLALNTQTQSRNRQNRIFTSRELFNRTRMLYFADKMYAESIPLGKSPQAQPRSRLPVLGSSRNNAFLGAEAAPAYVGSPLLNRQPLGGARNFGGFGFANETMKQR